MPFRRRTAYPKRRRYNRFNKYRYNKFKRNKMPLYKRSYPEVKYFDTEVTAQSINTTEFVKCFSGVPQGTLSAQRIGNSITIKSLNIKATLQSTASTGVDQRARVIIFLWKDPTGAAFSNVTHKLLDGVSVIAQRNVDNQAHYRVLMDKVIHLNAAGEPGSTKYMEYFKRMRLPARFSNIGTNEDERDHTTNALMMLIVGEQASGSTDGILDLTARMKFTDA